jgi:hypothetical protein
MSLLCSFRLFRLECLLVQVSPVLQFRTYIGSVLVSFQLIVSIRFAICFFIMTFSVVFRVLDR